MSRSQRPRMIARPAQETKRDAFVRMLDRDHWQYIVDACRAQGGISEETTKDVANRVLEKAAEQFEKVDFGTDGGSKNLRAWLWKLAQNAASNHRRLWKPKIAPGAEADDVRSPAPDPEGTAQLAERRARLSRYLDTLPEPQKEVVVCADLYEMKIEDIAVALRRPEGTVASQLARARESLKERAEESDRATAAGKRRR
jgi:RNA polymerase sigma factor (sigma-70 family)